MPKRPETSDSPSAARRSRRFAAFALIVGLVGLTAGCSTPRTASGSLDAGKERVTQLVLEAARALPATVQFQPPTEVGTQPCRKTVAGYVIGSTGAHRAEVPLIVKTPGNRPAPSFLPNIEAAWSKAGYKINRSRLSDRRFPQVSATDADGNEVVATAFAPTSKIVEPSQIDLYSVSQCLRGS